jgi:tetratricopeptide (TPR) repeat protein
MFVEAGNQALNRSLRKEIKDRDAEIKLQRNYAKKFFEAALLAKPESFQALIGLALARQYAGEKDDAIKAAQAAAAAAPEYAAGHYVLAAILSKAGKPEAATAAMKKAEETDPLNLAGRLIPTVDEARVFFYRNGRLPLIVPPSVKR